MQLLPYLDFAGDCREAFEFYRDALDGEIVDCMTYRDSPMAADIPADTHDRIMHAMLRVGDAELMGADGPPPHDASGKGTCVNVMADTVEQAERIWSRLSKGADVRMPLQPTFWSQRFGMLVDRYGKPWMVDCIETPPAVVYPA